jgi:dolichol-phosphate mannosyltransferase
MSPKIIIGLPAYNEEQSLPQLLEKIVLIRKDLGNELDVLIANDGSTDRTKTCLDHFEREYEFIRVIHHTVNKGLGVAIQSILSHVIGHYDDNDVLITLDADNTHNPYLIPALFQKLQEEHLDVVIASRFIKGGKEDGLSIFRKICSRGAKLFFKLFFPIEQVNDYSCGYRCYRIGYLRRACLQYGGSLITSSGFECMAEILAKFSKIGVRAGEYPLVLQYHLKQGKSKLKVLRTVRGYFRLLSKV